MLKQMLIAGAMILCGLSFGCCTYTYEPARFSVRDAETGLVLLTLPGHNDSVSWLAFSPDGAFLKWKRDRS